MRIGIIGSGPVSTALSTGLTRHGHDVRLGTREPDKPELAGHTTGTAADVAEWAELVVLAVAGKAAEQVAGDLAKALAGKVVADATNPLDFSSGEPELFVGTTDSLGERVQRAAPGARVVKAYNIVGNVLMVDPALPDGPPSMLIAGDDDAAKDTVSQLLIATGWDVVDLGGIKASRWLEPMALAWVAHGIRSSSWEHAFRLLR